ncbi:MAG: TetR/AcrR family transcriptional regulator [Bacteroidota bacterium]
MKAVIKESRLDHIINCAENVFFEKGFLKTNISDICKSANCSRTTLYSHFESKENVYLAVVNKSFKLFISYFLKFDTEEGNGMEKILRFSKGYIDFSKKFPKNYALILDFYSILKNIKNKKIQSDTDLLLSKCSYFKTVKKNAAIPSNFLIQIIEAGQQDNSITDQIPASILFLNMWAYLIGSSHLFNFSTQKRFNILGVRMEDSEENTLAVVRKILE